MKSILETLLAKSMPEPNSGCWLWLGEVNEKGYGRATIDGRRTMAHRAMWSETHGSIPDKLLVCHRCDVPGCINPSHLFLGTHADNARDMKEKKRHRFGERHVRAKLGTDDAQAICTDRRKYWDIAAEFGVNASTVCAIKAGRAWSHITSVERHKNPLPNAHGQENGNARLTEDDVRSILADPRGRNVLAREYGVHPSNIGNIRHGRRWKHLSERATSPT